MSMKERTVTLSEEEEGGVYVGSWKDGFAHGQGRRIFADGTMYEGEWRNGTMNGRGVQFLPSGLTYEGQFRASLKHGSGRLRKSPPVAEAIEDSLAAMKAIAAQIRGQAPWQATSSCPLPVASPLPLTLVVRFMSGLVRGGT